MDVNKKFKIIAIFTIIPMLLIFSCSKKVKKDEDLTGKKDPVEKTEERDARLDKKYMKEGFISNNTFRVIILATLEECENDITGIEEKARKRAIATLQKLLISKNRIVDNNVRTEILNIVNRYGNLKNKDIRCGNNNVFFFDIEKNNLSQYLMKITHSR